MICPKSHDENFFLVTKEEESLSSTAKFLINQDLLNSTTLPSDPDKDSSLFLTVRKQASICKHCFILVNFIFSSDRI